MVIWMGCVFRRRRIIMVGRMRCDARPDAGTCKVIVQRGLYTTVLQGGHLHEVVLPYSWMIVYEGSCVSWSCGYKMHDCECMRPALSRHVLSKLRISLSGPVHCATHFGFHTIVFPFLSFAHGQKNCRHYILGDMRKHKFSILVTIESHMRIKRLVGWLPTTLTSTERRLEYFGTLAMYRRNARFRSLTP